MLAEIVPSCCQTKRLKEVYEAARVMEKLSSYHGPHGWNESLQNFTSLRDPDMLIGSSQGAKLLLTPARKLKWHERNIAPPPLPLPKRRQEHFVDAAAEETYRRVVHSNCPDYPSFRTGVKPDGTPLFEILWPDGGVHCAAAMAVTTASAIVNGGRQEPRAARTALKAMEGWHPWTVSIFHAEDKRQCQIVWAKTLSTLDARGPQRVEPPCKPAARYGEERVEETSLNLQLEAEGGHELLELLDPDNGFLEVPLRGREGTAKAEESDRQVTLTSAGAGPKNAAMRLSPVLRVCRIDEMQVHEVSAQPTEPATDGSLEDPWTLFGDAPPTPVDLGFSDEKGIEDLLRRWPPEPDEPGTSVLRPPESMPTWLVNGEEWSYGATETEEEPGVNQNKPKMHPDHHYRQTVVMPCTHLSAMQIEEMTKQLSQEPLRPEEVPAVPADLRAAQIVSQAQDFWQAEKERALRLGQQPNLERVFWKVCRKDVVIGSLFGCASGCVTTVARPLLLQALVNGLATDSDTWKLSLWAAALSLALMFEGVTLSFTRHIIMGNATFAGLAHVHSLRVATCHARAQDAPDIGNLVGNDAVRFQQNLFTLSLVPGASVSLIGGIAILVYTLGVAGIVGLACMIGMLFLNTRISQLAKKAEKENLAKTDVRMRIMTQIVQGIRAIKFCAWEDSFKTILSKERALECIPLKWYRVLTQSTVQIGRANPIVGCLFAFLLLAISARNDPESFRPSDIFAALNVFLALRSGLIAIPEGLIYIATTRVAVRRLQDFLVTPEALRHVTQKDSGPCIRVKSASFRWPEKHAGVDSPEHAPERSASTRSVKSAMTPGAELLVDDVEVPRGCFTAVVGSVGSGKSSLVAALLGEMPPSSDGLVELRGRRLAFIPQKAFVLSGTIKENIAFAEEDPNEVDFQAALAAASLSEDLTRMPKQEFTEVGERGVVLSGGQQQRLSIARALYRRADLVIADDPISALDPIVADEVFLSLKRCVTASSGCHSCLVVLNQPWLLTHFDHVLMVAGGQVVQRGTPQELLRSDGPLKSFCLESGCDIPSMLSRVGEPEEPLAMDRQKPGKMEQGKPVEGVTELVKAEEKLAGGVPLRVLVRYVSGMGFAWFGLCNFLVLLAYCTLGFVDYWLALWVEAREAYWTEGKVSNDDLYVAVYGIAAAMFVVLMCLTSYCFGEGGVRSSRHLHSECLNNLLHAPVHFFDATPSGRIMSRFSNDIAIVDKEIPKWIDNAWQLSATTLMLFVQVVVLVNLMLPVVVTAACLFVLQIIVIYRTNRELRRYANAAMGPVLTTVNECVNGRQVIRTMDARDFFEKRLCANLDDYHRFSFSALGSVNAGGVFAFLICFLTASSTSAVVIVNRDQYPPSFCALALTYSFLMPYFLNFLSMTVQLLLTALTGLERLLQYGDQGMLPAEPPWQLSSDRSPEVWPAAGRVTFEAVSLVYRPGLPKAVDGISFELRPGEKVGVVGRSGAGKSTLMVLLLRLNEVTEGRILIDGVDISKIGLGKLRKAIAVVPQEPLLIEGTVQENLDPFAEHSSQKLAEVLEKVELEPSLLAQASSASTLSQGERQLLTLARTLLWPSRVRVFDEPTSNIDAATDRLIQRFLRSPTMFGQSTQITVAHRLQTVVSCDRILVMSSGKVVESGPPRELLDRPNSHLSALAAHAGVELKTTPDDTERTKLTL
ncbi:ABC transporter C family member 2 [Symbiodinium microadriaticum]|uniref:ABC transporter C family member 2 n=1 Tax=Symbiodinium microadriaticum TaxID=2951 RepID=A0A1Q9EC57_SYMMI|nr:ABC transporter C family member 2 [Symbiodinium microadriaticum]